MCFSHSSNTPTLEPLLVLKQNKRTTYSYKESTSWVVLNLRNHPTLPLIQGLKTENQSNNS